MAHVVVATAFGGPEVLSLVEEDAGSPGAGEVRIAVRAAGVNPVDWKRYSGAMGTGAELPMRLGSEAAGVVTEAGSDAAGPAGPVAVGDEVIAFRVDGAYADELVVPASAVVPKPAGMSWEAAGGLMLAGATAAHAVAATRVAAGDTVLVHAAAGGVGLLLTQLATRLGARVIGTVSALEKEKLARDAGAAEIIGYDSVAEDVRRLTDGKGIPAAYDGVGRITFDASLASLRPHGVLVLYGYSSGPPPPFDINRLLHGGSLYITRPTLRHFIATPEELTRRADEVLGLVADGSLSVHIGGRYPLAEAGKAHTDLQSRRTTGKLILLP
jgi:NADPH2:quinone reductase